MTKVDYLDVTMYIDSNHPAIIETAKRLTAGAKTNRERAVRIHYFVRDRIRFGFAPAFYNQKASEVLRSGIGFCNTKTTLIIALMRASEIPARHHFVTINAHILVGLIDPGTPFVDHSCAEVNIDRKWYKIDSYIVDRALAEKSKKRLIADGKMLGYGVHRNGVSEWDGKSDAFSQFVNDGTVRNFTTVDHGIFDDVGMFYASGRELNKLNFFTRLMFGFFSRSANKKIEIVRQSPNCRSVSPDQQKR